jgi:hypothetical protein
MKCPPLDFNEPLLQMIESYRVAKRAASTAARQRLGTEAGGHYDNDVPLQQRAVAEGEEALTERLAAIRLADELLQWVDKHRA